MDATTAQRRTTGSGGNSVPLRIVAAAIAAVALLLLGGCGTAPVRPSDASRPARVGDPATDADGGRVAALASKYVGTPYRYGGATPDGFDCSGLVWYVHREAGISVPRTAVEQRAAASPVPRERLQPGDLVFFYTPQDHVGIYLGDGEFVHAPATGRRVERARIDSPFFILAFSGGGRFAR
jgi:cell wall-associated NlpC family hydrolase